MSRVTWDEQDCLEMPLLASKKIEKLQAENKALKESRDELLIIAQGFRKQILLGEKYIINGKRFCSIVEEAEALKEKEA